MQMVNALKEFDQELTSIIGACTLKFGALEHVLRNAIKNYKKALQKAQYQSPDNWGLARNSYEEVHQDYKKGAGLDKSNWLGLSNGKKTLQNRWLQAKQVA